MRYGRGRRRATSPRSRSSGREPRIVRGPSRTRGVRSTADQPTAPRRETRIARSYTGAFRDGLRRGAREAEAFRWPETSLTNRARGNTVVTARFPASRSRGSEVESATRIGARRRPSVPIAPARTLRELTGSRSSARTNGTLTTGTAGRPRRRRSRLTARPPLSVSRETTRTPTRGSSEPPNGLSRGTTRHLREA